jgi:hypothetical protein
LSKNLFAKAGVAAFLVVAASAANAQTAAGEGLAVRLGTFFPTGSASDLGRGGWLAFGADYRLPSRGLAAPTTDTVSFLSLSGDFYQRSNTSALPIALNYNVRSGAITWYGGLGLDFVRLGTNTSGFAGQLGAKYHFGTGPNPWFLEGKYFLSSRSALNGVGVYIGTNF